MGIRNLWTLNVDELLVADKLKAHFKKSDYEVFFPLNSQMKNIDLVVMNINNLKAKSIQVKGSRTYEKVNKKTKQYGVGSTAWFTIAESGIFNTTNPIDYFIFVLHSFKDTKLKKEIVNNFLVVPSSDFREICKQKEMRSGERKYDFYIWISADNKSGFETRGKINIPLSKYLNNWNQIKI